MPGPVWKGFDDEDLLWYEDFAGGRVRLRILLHDDRCVRRIACGLLWWMG